MNVGIMRLKVSNLTAIVLLPTNSKIFTYSGLRKISAKSIAGAAFFFAANF
jgi:hypothetical protein